MKSVKSHLGLLSTFVLLIAAGLAFGSQAITQSDPLPSWNDGPAKNAIVEFVRTTTDEASPKFVPPEARIATFDQDGTLWVEHLHDDTTREYAYGPAQGLPDTKVGTFPQALYDEAKKQGWVVISMKSDWKRIFAFEK